RIFQNDMGMQTLLLMVLAKFIATAISIGARLPGGLIGPTLVMGAVCGGAFSLIINALLGIETSPALYAMIGMGAMMSATLQAPLAALMAIFELTNSSDIILPGLLAIAAASLTSSELLKQPSVFFALMQAREIDQPEDQVSRKDEADNPPR
ncbi:MAG: chloride channel protein, partial [Gammaproteobacteria bacterium]|nr:chloride channel protein [Gammaproteobacteria bacterium]